MKITFKDMNRWDTFPKYLKSLGVNKGIEVGVEKGNYSMVLIKNNIRMTLVDSWETGEQYKEELYNKLETVSRELYPTVLEMRSTEAAETIKDRSFDFVYIDANHDYKHCYEDIEAWEPKIKDGGVISGHDFLDEYGVKKAVIDWAESHGVDELFVLNEQRGNPSWFFIKNGKPKEQNKDRPSKARKG